MHLFFKVYGSGTIAVLKGKGLSLGLEPPRTKLSLVPPAPWEDSLLHSIFSGRCRPGGRCT